MYTAVNYMLKLNMVYAFILKTIYYVQHAHVIKTVNMFTNFILTIEFHAV